MHAGQVAKRNKVLVVGGQFAGRRAAQTLADDFDVVLIDCKPAFEYTPSLLRCLVEPAYVHNIVIPHVAAVDSPRVVLGTVTSVQPGATGGSVLLEGGVAMAYDYLVIAAGSSYAQALIKLNHKAGAQARMQEIQAAAAQLATASSVVVVGGGPVGVELAAEIIGRYGAGKKVTLISSAQKLLHRMPARASTYAQEWLEQHGVELVLGHKIIDVNWEEVTSSTGPHVLQTDGGYILKCELVFNCTGTSPNTAPFASLQQARQQGQPLQPQEQASSQQQQAGSGGTASSSDSSSPSSGIGGLAVLPTLQVVGHERIFACGDVADLPFEKTAFTADLSASLAAANIKRLAAGEPLRRFPQDVCFGASSPPKVMAISLYKHDGILQFNRLVLTGSLAVWNKVAIEQLQLSAVRNGMVAKVWAVFERASVLFGRWLLR